MEDPALVEEMMRRASGVHEIPGVPRGATEVLPEKPERPIDRRGSGGTATNISLTPPPSPTPSTTSRNAARLEEALPLGRESAGIPSAEEAVPQVPAAVLDEEEALILEDSPSVGASEELAEAEPLVETRPSKSTSTSLKRVKPGTTSTLKREYQRRNSQPDANAVKAPGPRPAAAASGAGRDNKLAYAALGFMALLVVMTGILVAKGGDDTKDPSPVAQGEQNASETKKTPEASPEDSTKKSETEKSGSPKEDPVLPVADAGVAAADEAPAAEEAGDEKEQEQAEAESAPEEPAPKQRNLKRKSHRKRSPRC